MPPMSESETWLGGVLSIVELEDVAAALRFFWRGSPLVSRLLDDGSESPMLVGFSWDSASWLSDFTGKGLLGVEVPDLAHLPTMLLLSADEEGFGGVKCCSTRMLSESDDSASWWMVSRTRSMLSSRTFLGFLLSDEFESLI